MAFNYSNLKFLISRAVQSGGRRRKITGNCWWLHQHFLHFSFSLRLCCFSSALSLLQPSPATEKAIHLSLEAFFSVLSFFSTHSPRARGGMKNDRTFINRNWNWHIDEDLKKRTYFSKSCIINESLSRRGVHYCRMISLIKHFTVYRSDLEWIIDFALHVISAPADFSFQVNLCLCQLIARHATHAVDSFVNKRKLSLAIDSRLVAQFNLNISSHGESLNRCNESRSELKLMVLNIISTGN